MFQVSLVRQRPPPLLRQEEGRGSGDTEGRGEDGEDEHIPLGATSVEEEGDQQGSQDRGQPAETGGSPGTGAAHGGRVDLRGDRVERTPGTEVAEGERAPGDDDRG